MVTVALEGLENMLKTASLTSHLPAVLGIFHDCGGVSYMEALQSHNNKSIYMRAVRVLETYFGAEEEGDDGVPGVDGGMG
ncbi:hypothetical protein EON64_16180, partial [archaeon]